MEVLILFIFLFIIPNGELFKSFIRLLMHMYNFMFEELIISLMCDNHEIDCLFLKQEQKDL